MAENSANVTPVQITYRNSRFWFAEVAEGTVKCIWEQTSNSQGAREKCIDDCINGQSSAADAREGQEVRQNVQEGKRARGEAQRDAVWNEPIGIAQREN